MEQLQFAFDATLVTCPGCGHRKDPVRHCGDSAHIRVCAALAETRRDRVVVDVREASI